MSSVRLVAVFAAVAVPLLAPLACSSSQKAVTSGGAHFEIVSFASASVAQRCDDVGKQVNVAVDQSGDFKLVVDGSDGATVSCNFDDKHYNVEVVNNFGYFSAQGTFQGTSSSDGFVTLGFPGANYRSATGTACKLEFAQKSDNQLTAYVACDEIDNQATTKQCAMNQATNGHISNTYFKFKDCNP